MNSLQQIKFESVLNNIKSIMLNKGLDTLIISDIAKEIEIGEATIYRYFGNRLNLVIQVGISLWSDIYEKLSSREEKGTGYESIAHFFNYFIEVYETQKKAFAFLDQFDSFMIKERASKEDLALYDQKLSDIKKIFDILFLQAQNDQSIKDNIDRDTYYYTTTHMIIGICKKLALNGHMLLSNDIVLDISQIKLALDMCLNYIKRKRD
jgi:AcrR family transcriptional regulator